MNLKESQVIFAFIGSLVVYNFFFIFALWNEGNKDINEILGNYDRADAIATYAAMPKTVIHSGVTSQFFLEQGTSAELSAGLQSKLKDLAASSGVKVASASILKPKTEGPLTMLGANLQMSGSINSIYGLISQLESAQPFLFIDRLNIRSNDPQQTGQTGDTTLTVEIDVYGVLQGGSTTSKSAVPSG